MTPSHDHSRIGEIVVEARRRLYEFSAPNEIRVHAYPPCLWPGVPDSREPHAPLSQWLTVEPSANIHDSPGALSY